MKPKHVKTIYLLLLSFVMFWIMGCAHTPDKSALQHMTPSDARAFLRKIDLSYNLGLLNVDGSLYKVAKVVVTNSQIIIIDEGLKTHNVQIKKIKSVVYKHEPFVDLRWRVFIYYYDNGSDQIHIDNKNFGKQFMDSIYVIKETATNEAEKDESIFQRALQSYRNASTKPAISEDVRKFKVQAETSVREKRFGDAAEFYESGLNIAPWWLEGHFNRALVLAEVGDFETAVVEMNRYIRLAPDAPNIRSAQDKIYEWESKVPKRSDVQNQRK